MKFKRFEAETEDLAIEMVKEELGIDALILSVREVPRGGFLGLFMKPKVEVTAALGNNKIDESKYLEEKEMMKTEKDKLLVEQELKNHKIKSQEVTIKKLQERVNNLNKSLDTTKNLYIEKIYDNNIIQAFYETMIRQGVLPKVADAMLKEVVDIADASDINLNLVAKIVYNNIINVLGKPAPINIKKDSDKAKIVLFMGPTGVGKTTTIAKLSANFILEDNLNVGLITADTYRIAAVEQLKTYGDILGVEVGVVYDEDEFKEKIDIMEPLYDIICVDTAGRSHKNKENIKDLEKILESVPEDNTDIYLVLSLTTKYEDLLDIIDNFEKLTDFKLIFTKWDETLTYGTILNICYETGKKANYLTIGQNVPEDIEVLKPEILARALLGLGGDFIG